jgi:hypothetical protein
MVPAHAEPARNDPNCEIRLGTSSWDENCKSVKYTWFVNGKAQRGGEFPIDALPQMLEFAIRKGFLTLKS